MKKVSMKEELLSLCHQVAKKASLDHLGDLIEIKSSKVKTLKPETSLFDKVTIHHEDNIVKEICYSCDKTKLDFKVLNTCFSKYQIGYSFRDDISQIVYLEHSFPMTITTDLNNKLIDNNGTFEIISSYGEKQSIKKDLFPIYSLCFKYL